MFNWLTNTVLIFILFCSSGIPNTPGSLGGATGAGLTKKRETVKECWKQSQTSRRLHLHLPEEPGATSLGPVHAANVSSFLWAADFVCFLMVHLYELLQPLTCWWRCLFTLFQAGWSQWIMMTVCCSAACSTRPCIQMALSCCARKLYIQDCLCIFTGTALFLFFCLGQTKDLVLTTEPICSGCFGYLYRAFNFLVRKWRLLSV